MNNSESFHPTLHRIAGIADDPAHSAGESAAAAREEAAAKLMASAFRVTDDAVLDAGIDSGSTGCTALVGRREHPPLAIHSLPSLQ